MAKKTELAKTEETGGALAQRSAMGGAAIAGRDASNSISRVVMFQGTAQEEALYGSDFKRGDFIETLEKRLLGKSIEIVCVAGWMSWSKFVEGQTAPVYSFRSKAEVPAEDLEWGEEGAAKRSPAACETVNMVCVVNGEPFPALFMFKRTSIKAYTKVIEPCESRFGRCVYELSSEDDKNASGQPYKRLKARMVRKLSEGDALIPIVTAIEFEFKKAKAKFEKTADAAPDEDSIPI